MGNRFTRGILEGSISSEEELKTAYKNEAKKTHPDLAEVAGHEDFLKLRAEYEQALSELSRGARPPERNGNADGTDDPYAALEILLKRGFPKVPRHRKESLRYNYARLRARSALKRIDPFLPALFDAMEKESLNPDRLKAKKTIIGLLGGYLKAERLKSGPLLAAMGMEVARTFPPIALGPDATAGPGGSEDRPGPAAAAFFRALVGSSDPRGRKKARGSR